MKRSDAPGQLTERIANKASPETRLFNVWGRCRGGRTVSDSPFIPIFSPMKALISCIVSLLLLATGVVASWYVWFRPDAKPIAAARLAAAEAAKSTVESITGKKFMIEGSDKNSSDDLPRRSNDKPESENDLFAERERQQRDAQDRKQYAEDARVRPLVYPKAQEEVRKELPFPQMAKFSELQDKDDQHSICRRVRGGLWESRGVTDHLDKTGKKHRSVWRVLHRSSSDGAIETLYLEVGDVKRGSMDAAVKASLVGTESN